MSRTLFSLAGFQVITLGRFWVIAEGFTVQRFPEWFMGENVCAIACAR